MEVANEIKMITGPLNICLTLPHIKIFTMQGGFMQPIRLILDPHAAQARPLTTPRSLVQEALTVFEY